MNSNERGANFLNRTPGFILPLIACILVIGGLRLTMVVTLPLVLALFVLVLCWPLFSRLEKRLPSVLSLILTLAAVLTVAGLFVVVLLFCFNTVTTKADFYVSRIGALVEEFREWEKMSDFPFSVENIDPVQILGRSLDVVRNLALGAYEYFWLILLSFVFLALSLVEVRPMGRRLEEQVSPDTAQKLVAASVEIAWTMQRFMLTRSLTSALTGLATGLYTWWLGLDFALIWGISAFLLNYLPVLGSVVAVIPPSIVALLQPENPVWLMTFTLGGLFLIQFSIGNYLDPWLQGKYLSLSPMLVFFSILFWGWVWDIPGALLGVPITVACVIVGRYFESTRWMSEMVTHSAAHTAAESDSKSESEMSLSC